MYLVWVVWLTDLHCVSASLEWLLWLLLKRADTVRTAGWPAVTLLQLTGQLSCYLNNEDIGDDNVDE